MKAFPHDYQRKRLIICTDVGGGDRDDHQSLIHYLFYANMFQLDGIVVGRPKGKLSAVWDVLKAYKKDFPKLDRHSTGTFKFPTPSEIKSVCVEGASPGGRTPSRGWDRPTDGSRAIIRAARSDYLNPLHVLCWGACTDLAQAVHDAPDIAENIEAFVVGGVGYNYEWDPAPCEYLKRNKDLRWILSDGTVRGLYMPGLNSKKKYGNVGFVEKVVKRAGYLGRLFYQISEPINVNRYGIKMGDTGSLLFLFNGDFAKPESPSWGGDFSHAEYRRYEDRPNFKLGPYPGALTLAIHRTDILKDWEQRLAWLM